MEQRALQMLVSTGAPASDMTIERSVDIRYSGQGYEIEVAISGIDLASGDDNQILAHIRQRFETAYTRHYGRALDTGTMEAITWRIKAYGKPLSLNLNPQAPADSGAGAIGRERRVYFGPEHGHVTCPVIDRYRLSAGQSGTGPSLMEERETTVVISPGAAWTVDAHLNIIVTI
jgi:N-methylhydantoinase A